MIVGFPAVKWNSKNIASTKETETSWKMTSEPEFSKRKKRVESLHFPLFIHIYSLFLLVRRGNYHNPNGLQKMLYCIKNVCAFHSMSLECLMMQWGNVLLELRLFRHCITKISVGIIFNRRIKLYYLISISSTAHHNPKCSKRNEKNAILNALQLSFYPRNIIAVPSNFSTLSKVWWKFAVSILYSTPDYPYLWKARASSYTLANGFKIPLRVHGTNKYKDDATHTNTHTRSHTRFSLHTYFPWR